MEKKKKKIGLHWPGIEPGPPAWQARILPLNHQCFAVFWWRRSAVCNTGVVTKNNIA